MTSLNVTLHLDLEQLTKQRAAVLAANPDDRGPLAGVLNLLDDISDQAELSGLLSPEDRTRWWREGCIEAGLGDPALDNE